MPNWMCTYLESDQWKSNTFTSNPVWQEVAPSPCNTVKQGVFLGQRARKDNSLLSKASVHLGQSTSIESQNWTWITLYSTGLFPEFLHHYLWEWVPFWTMHQYWAALPYLIRALIGLLTLPAHCHASLYLLAVSVCMSLWKEMEIKWWECMNDCFWQAVAQ